MVKKPRKEKKPIVEGVADRFTYVLKAARRGANLTQEELAEKIDMSRAVIASIEQGKSAPSFDLLVLLMDALDISFDELVRAEKSASSAEVIREEITVYIDRVEDPQKLAEVLEMLKKPGQK